jgi:hypothetical protein
MAESLGFETCVPDLNSALPLVTLVTTGGSMVSLRLYFPYVTRGENPLIGLADDLANYSWIVLSTVPSS